MKNQFVNQRRHKRIQVDRPILKDGQFTAIDLSEEGMQLGCKREPYVGETLTLNLDLDGAAVTVNAKVMWVRADQSIFSSSPHAGVKFTGYSTMQRLAVRDFINSMQPKE